MKIYKVTPEDIYWIATLWKKLSDYHKNFTDYISPSIGWRQWIIRIYNEDINRKDRLILVAKDRLKPVGFIRAEIRKTVELYKYNLSGYISDLYVEEEYRGLGIAEKLVNGVVNWLIKMGIYSLRLSVSSENINALKFYNKLGFIEVNKTLKLELK